MNIRRVTPCIFATALAAAGLLATTTAAQAGLGDEHAQGPVAYISGGIGSDEAAALRQVAPSYPLTLELASPSGGWRDGYVSDARVEIRDQQGHSVLSTSGEGPLLLVRLPTGTYGVEVDWNGTVRRQTVNIEQGRPQHIVFEFPAGN